MKKRFDPRRKAYGETPRQALIARATLIMRRQGYTAHEALEAVVDGAQPGSWGAEMRAYYRGASEGTISRLIRAVEREAR